MADDGAGPGQDGEPGLGSTAGHSPIGPGGDLPPIKRYIVGGTVNVSVARERVQYLNAQGKLITESLRDYTRINVMRQFDALDKFLQAWSDAERNPRGFVVRSGFEDAYRPPEPGSGGRFHCGPR